MFIPGAIQGSRIVWNISNLISCERLCWLGGGGLAN